MAIQLLVLTTFQEQFPPSMTPTKLLAAPKPCMRRTGEMTAMQFVAPRWLTVKRSPPTTMIPLRSAWPGLAATA